MRIEEFLKIFGKDHSAYGYVGKTVPSGDVGMQYTSIINTLTTLGVEVPASDGIQPIQDWSRREVTGAEGRIWTLSAGRLVPYDLTSVQQMHREMEEGTIFVIRPTHRKDATAQQREIPESLQVLFNARYNENWTLMVQDSQGLSAMSTSLATDPLVGLDNAGGLLKAIADIFIWLVNWLAGDENQISTYAGDRSEAEKLNRLKDLGLQLQDKVMDVGEDGQLVLKDVPKQPAKQDAAEIPPEEEIPDQVEKKPEGTKLDEIRETDEELEEDQQEEDLKEEDLKEEDLKEDRKEEPKEDLQEEPKEEPKKEPKEEPKEDLKEEPKKEEPVIPEKQRNTTPERVMEQRKGDTLVDVDYLFRDKPLPGLEDIHEMGKQLGEFDVSRVRSLTNYLTSNVGHNPEIRGIIALIGATGLDYATKAQHKNEGLSSDAVRGKLIDILINPTEEFSTPAKMVQSRQRGALDWIGIQAVEAFDRQMRFEKVGDKWMPYGDVIFTDLRRTEEEALGSGERCAKRSITHLTMRHSAHPRLGEHTIKLAQLSRDICHWAYAQNRPLNMTQAETIALRGSIILADVTRKGLDAQRQMQQGAVNDGLLKDFWAMKVLEQSFLADYMQDKSGAGRPRGVSKMITALGDPRTGKTMLDNLYRCVEERINDPETKAKLTRLVNEKDKKRDAFCLEMYTDVISRMPTEPTKERVHRRVNFGGSRFNVSNELTATEKARIVDEVVIEDVGREMLTNWKENIREDEGKKETRFMDETLAVEKRLRFANLRHERNLANRKYKSYHEFSDREKGLDLPGKPKKVQIQEQPDNQEQPVIPQGPAPKI